MKKRLWLYGLVVGLLILSLGYWMRTRMSPSGGPRNDFSINAHTGQNFTRYNTVPRGEEIQNPTPEEVKALQKELEKKPPNTGN